MFSIMQQVKFPIFLLVVMGDLLHNVNDFFHLAFDLELMLVVLHTYSPPVSEKISYAICSNIATNIVESLPGIWGKWGKGGGR